MPLLIRVRVVVRRGLTLMVVSFQITLRPPVSLVMTVSLVLTDNSNLVRRFPFPFPYTALRPCFLFCPSVCMFDSFEAAICPLRSSYDRTITSPLQNLLYSSLFRSSVLLPVTRSFTLPIPTRPSAASLSLIHHTQTPTPFIHHVRI